MQLFFFSAVLPLCYGRRRLNRRPLSGFAVVFVPFRVTCPLQRYQG
jgi:hypothetical protein